jgi:hypothetical protein
MKTIIFEILFCLPMFIFGQIKLINLDLTNKDTNLLYSGIENRIALIGNTNKIGIRMSSSQKMRISNEKDYFVILPATKERDDTLRVFKGSKLLYYRVFNIVKLNDPIAQVAFTTDTVISINKLIANPFINSRIPNSLYELSFIIKSFQCTVLKSTGERKVFFTLGNRFSEETLEAIKKLKSSDELIFENIIVGISPMFCQRMLPILKLKIQ